MSDLDPRWSSLVKSEFLSVGEPRTYALFSDLDTKRLAILCLRCYEVSCYPHDVSYRYCPSCQRYHTEDPL